MTNARLKAGWRKVKFGDIAENIAVRVSPASADTDVYVGLEHLEPETLHLRRWGHPSDVEGDKLRFCKGDVIFARRRAYQRKLALAEFDGICSAHAMVIRAKPKMILPEFLPFFLQSDMFMERAIEISVGSLSPTINWRVLREQEFHLSSIEEQEHIAEILWATDDAVERWLSVSECLEATKQIMLGRAFDEGAAVNGKWKLRKLKEVATVQTGIAKGRRYSDSEPLVELPYLRVANVKDGYLDLTEIKTLPILSSEMNRYLVKDGDVLLTEGGDFDKLGRGTVWRGEISRCLHQNHVFCVRPKNGVLLPDFLSYQAASSYGKTYFLKCAKKTSNLASINSTQVKDFPVLLPPLEEQQRMIRIVKALESELFQCNEHLGLLRSLLKSYLTSIGNGKDLHV